MQLQCARAARFLNADRDELTGNERTALFWIERHLDHLFSAERAGSDVAECVFICNLSLVRKSWRRPSFVLRVTIVWCENGRRCSAARASRASLFTLLSACEREGVPWIGSGGVCAGKKENFAFTARSSRGNNREL